MKVWIEKALTSPHLECLARWLLGMVFVYAALPKIVAPASFAKIIYGYGLLPGVMINGFAVVFPLVEACAGMCLILGVFPRSAAILANSLLVVFILAISINLIRGHEFDCGCFSVSRGSNIRSGVELLIRDTVLIGVGFIPVLFRGNRRWVFWEKIRPS